MDLFSYICRNIRILGKTKQQITCLVFYLCYNYVLLDCKTFCTKNLVDYLNVVILSYEKSSTIGVVTNGATLCTNSLMKNCSIWMEKQKSSLIWLYKSRLITKPNIHTWLHKSRSLSICETLLPALSKEVILNQNRLISKPSRLAYPLPPTATQVWDFNTLQIENVTPMCATSWPTTSF